MSKIQNDILIVPPRLQYKLSTDKVVSIPVELTGDRKELIDSARTINIDAYQQSQIERTESTTYRLSGKITQIFSNVLTGATNYEGYKNYLYLTDPVSVLSSNDVLFSNKGERVVDTFGIKWRGYPQYHEFSFIRTDSDNPQFQFQPKSAATYNWTPYLTYVYSSTTAQTMSYVNQQLSGNTVNFRAGDGIPFTIVNTVANGSNYITFRCGGKHNLTPAQFVELSIDYNGNRFFQVDAIGEEGYDNEDTSFSILNYGYTGNTFLNGVSGTFKRIGDIANSAETKSQYYVRLHKTLTDDTGVVFNKLAFENIPFSKKEKVEYSALTPNLVERVSTLEGTQVYSFTVIQDTKVESLITNFNKPVTSLFLTIINKGYSGWFNKPSTLTSTAVQYGWDFNFQENTLDTWWSQNNTNGYENIPVSSYFKVTPTGTYIFYYNSPLEIGHVLVGDFCEYNPDEQMEYLVSNLNHKTTYNESLYQVETQNTNIPPGYFHQTHFEIPIKKYSNEVSTELEDTPLQRRPFWAYFSESDGLWKWRNVLEPGEIEDDNNGVNYPFLNGAHYPFSQFIFKLRTPFRNINVTVPVTTQPNIDPCE